MIKKKNQKHLRFPSLIQLKILCCTLTDSEKERPHQSEMIARDEGQHDFPRPTGQSQECDPMWSHFSFLQEGKFFFFNKGKTYSF